MSGLFWIPRVSNNCNVLKFRLDLSAISLLDKEDAYLHIPIRLTVPKTFCDGLSLPVCGVAIWPISTATRMFNMVLTPFLGFLRTWGIPNVGHLGDLLLQEQSAQTLMSKYLSNWTCPEAVHLGTDPPETSIGLENLGLVLDLSQPKMSLPQERCLCFQAQLESQLSLEKNTIVLYIECWGIGSLPSVQCCMSSFTPGSCSSIFCWAGTIFHSLWIS